MTATMTLLRQARLLDRDAPVDLLLRGGKIAALSEHLPDDAVLVNAETWNLDGRVVLPGLVDLHTHLDKTYSTVHNASGTLQEAIDVWNAHKTTRTVDDARAAAERALRNAVAHGVTALRSHLNATDESDLPAIEMMVDLREQWRDRIDLQFVALGHPGLSARNDELMNQALALGVDLIGGAPALLDDPHASIDAALNLAERTDKPIDLHIDETEDHNTLTLAYLAEQTIARGMQGRVTAGHCCSLAFVDDDTAARTIEQVAKAEITVVTLPSCNLVLMGRGRQPAPRGVTRVKELLVAGVNVCAASDNVRDPFNPFGAYDLLQIANINAHAAHLTGDEALRTSLAMVTTRPSRAFGASSVGLHQGAPADLIVLDTVEPLDAVLCPPPRLATFKRGRLVVRTSIKREWSS